MNLKLTFSRYRAWIAFVQIFLCGLVGALIAWVSGLTWFMGMQYGCAIGCGIYAASQTDNSPKEPRHPL